MPVTGSDRIERHADFILAAVAETSDITLAELRAELIEERSETFGTTTIWRFFKRRQKLIALMRCGELVDYWNSSNTCLFTRGAKNSAGERRERSGLGVRSSLVASGCVRIFNRHRGRSVEVGVRLKFSATWVYRRKRSSRINLRFPTPTPTAGTDRRRR